jgi:hypothetical protein
MTVDDTAETYTFKESSSLGVSQGTVTIIEHKKAEDKKPQLQ